MFNFSANHLFLLSRTEYSSCAVFLMLDRDTQRVYRLLDFTKRLRFSPDSKVDPIVKTIFCSQ
jgi:hypothetical protein